jgi:hypothetical protein
MIAGTKIPNGANRIEDVDFLNKFKLVATEYDLIK